MGWLLLSISKISNVVESMLTREYARRHGNGGLFFNAIICLFACTFYALTDRNGFNFLPELWIYGIISAILYAIGFYSAFISFKYGSFVLSQILVSFSAIFSIIYGLAVLHEPSNVFTYIAITLTFGSLIIMNISNRTESADSKFSFKWLIAIIFAVLSNGFIGIISRLQQLRFNNACNNEFLIISLGGSFFALLIGSFIIERKDMLFIVKKGSVYGLLAGSVNGLKSTCNLLTYNYIPISLVSSIGIGISNVVSFIVSIFVYKERLSVQQFVGAIMGVCAIIMLNI